jgi:pimeloyl-ACP methyl ester carboxylesterase
VLRAALGESKLTYLGKSYGTYLGAWYAQLFPHRVRALVLDGALDPDSSGTSINLVQAEGFEVALRSFAANCMATAGCPLGQGSDVGAGIAKIQALLNHATRTPLANDLGDGRPANGALLLEGIAAALYSKAYWPTLRTALADAFGGDGTILIELGDLLLERNSNGTYSNLPDSNMAINCVDRPWPHALSVWQTDAAAAQKEAPQFGAAIMWGSLPCAYWPVPSYPLPDITGAGAPPILVVGTTRDPATPYRWAQALARELRSGVLLGWNGDGHTAYMMGSSCVDNIVNQYLISGAVPRSGTMCP